MFTAIALILLMLIAVLWYQGLQAKRHAVAASRNACDVRGWQFLDETAALAKIKIIYPRGGRLMMYRKYNFEYYDDNNSRQSSYVVLNGMHVVKVGLPQKENVVSLARYRQQASGN